MIVNQAALRGIYTSFNLIFQTAFSAAQPLWPKVATLVPSTTGEESYKWLGNFPMMREWIGDRHIKNLEVSDYTLKNKDFESTIAIDRNDIEDDKLGIYAPVVQELGEEAASYPDHYIFTLLPGGFTNKCYDGKAFFAQDHKMGKISYSNKGTKVLSVASYAAARTAIMSVKGENGASLRLKPDLLVVSPANESLGRKILYADQIEGTTNEWKGTAELLVVPELAGDKEKGWYLLCANRPLKPLIFQRRKEPKLVEVTSETSENVFMRKKFLYGADARANFGYGFWQMAYGSDGSQN